MTIGNPFEKGDNILKTQPSFLNFKSIKATTLSAITGVLLATSDLQAQEPTKTTPKKPKTEEVSKIAPKKPKTEEVSKKTPINTIEQFTNIKGISSMIECNNVSDNTITSAFKNYKKVQKLEGGVIDNQYEIVRRFLGVEFFKAKGGKENYGLMSIHLDKIISLLKTKEAKSFVQKLKDEIDRLDDEYVKQLEAARDAEKAARDVAKAELEAEKAKLEAEKTRSKKLDLDLRNLKEQAAAARALAAAIKELKK